MFPFREGLLQKLSLLSVLVDADVCNNFLITLGAAGSVL